MLKNIFPEYIFSFTLLSCYSLFAIKSTFIAYFCTSYAMFMVVFTALLRTDYANFFA